ncbi:DUF551 domain-containing protein [Klebsiella pneumoniae]|uniref:DUF551 domain-containing protein n=1 Tax=Klebsiella pneumoniae TaxID=573 RepID=UPI0021D22766|nr:DUF551 domain-containing protein [Klebsiella pneumoniae]MCP6434265.1 DUF551 domain-containing protein [Klebsiella pneumoniae]MCU6586105.1 DUF551 domain-containing protein [Klebsiella pneumoniae]
MTSKLTREQLHERARENVKALKMASRQTALESAREEILADLQLAELALAAMDSEPVAYISKSDFDAGYPHILARRDFNKACTLPVYAAQPAPEYPEVLPCPVLLEPGMRFGKGVKTRLVLDAIQRRAEQYAELEAMTQEERAEYDANIEAFKAMLPQPVPVAYSDFESFWSSYIHPLAQDDELKDFAWDIWNACRAAILAAAKHDTTALNSVQSVDSVADRWIPVSERMPELGDWLVTDGCDFDVQLFNGEQFIPGFVWEDKITHWMPLPAVPQEVKGE